MARPHRAHDNRAHASTIRRTFCAIIAVPARTATASTARRYATTAVRSDQLEQVVWDQVRSILEEPSRVANEYRRRIGQARDGAAMPDEIVRLNQQITAMRHGIGRLIDSYAEGVIDKTEFEPPIAGLKQRLSQLQERHHAALEAVEIERDLSLVISRLEDFSAKVTKRLDGLDRSGMQDIIRTLVRRIEIDESHIEVIFRVPPPDGPSRPSPTDEGGSWQHCTGVGRTNVGVDQPQPPFGT
jgi:site-specific DNA recombinase